MADLESMLADIAYIQNIEKSRTPGAKTLKKITLPDCSVHDVVHKWLTYKNDLTFYRVHKQRLGCYFLDKFVPETCPLYNFLKGILDYERTSSKENRYKKAKCLYDQHIYADMLAMSSKIPKEIIDDITTSLKDGRSSIRLFLACKDFLYTQLTDLYMPEFIRSLQYVRMCQWKYLELNIPHSITLNDFSVHRIIGRGGFGEVFGCRKDDTGKMFAMKLLDKKRIKLKKGELLALNERNMLAKVNSPFVVNLYYAFQTSDKLCFILDLMNGGDLHYHLTQHGVFNEHDTKFYAAELILALEHIHHQEIVYRDLKPSNVLLDELGHIRLSDLGLACEYSDRMPSSCVGTHGYMAPEVIKKGVQYDKSADWFSLGCLLYKLLRGHSPFRSQNKDEIDQITLTKEVQMHSSFSPEICELLTGLLHKEPANRWGCKDRGVDEIKESKFFSDINWDDVMEKKLIPPLLPPRGEVNAADAFDIGSFDSDETRSVKLTEDDQKTYSRFNVVVSDRWQAEIMESVFDMVNTQTDKQESKERSKGKNGSLTLYSPEPGAVSDCILQGYGSKVSGGGMFSQFSSGVLSRSSKKYFKLYSDRIEIGESFSNMDKGVMVISFDDASILVESKQLKGSDIIRIQPIGGKKEYCFKFDSQLEHQMWFKYLRNAIHKQDATKDTINPLALEDGGLLVQRRNPSGPGSPARLARESGHTRSVPIL